MAISRPVPPASTLRSLSPEARLLLLTAAVPHDDVALRDALGAGVDWHTLRALAHRERAAPIVLRATRRLGNEQIGPGYAELRQQATQSVIQMMHLERLLHQTLDGLAERGIDAMLLKGAGLAYSAYPAFADRPMGDLDILVRPERTQEAWDAMLAQGWKWPPTRLSLAQYTNHHHLPPLFDESVTFRLEIHRHVLPPENPFGLSANDIWLRARQVRSGDRVFTVPHPLHQLWHLCVHFAWSHTLAWGGWRTLRDAGTLIHAGEVDWQEFIALARQTRAATCCFWTLRLAQQLTGTTVPDRVLAELRPPRSEFLIDLLERHYSSNIFPSIDGSPSVWLSARLWEAGIAPRRSGHRSARPWHTSERWLAAAEKAPTADLASRPGWGLSASARRLGAVWSYLRRVARSAPRA